MAAIKEKFYAAIVHPVDPGFFISRHAGKAVMACLAALVVAWPFPREYTLWFVFSAFAVMMSRSGETFHRRKVTAVTVFTGAAILVPLSSVVGQTTVAAAVYLFFLVFTVFLAGVLGRHVAVGGVWLLFVNGLTLCSPAPLSTGLARAGAVLAGGAVAYMVNFRLWPVRPRRILRDCGTVAVRDLAEYFAAVAASFETPDPAAVDRIRDRARTSVRRYRRTMEAMGLDPLAGPRAGEDRMSGFYIVLVRVFKGVVALSRNSGFAARSPLFRGVRREFAGTVDEAGRTFACLAGLLESDGEIFEVAGLVRAVEGLEQGLLNLGAYQRGEGVRREFLEAWGAVYAMKSLVAELGRMQGQFGENRSCA
jgi:hypothetical protein